MLFLLLRRCRYSIMNFCNAWMISSSVEVLWGSPMPSSVILIAYLGWLFTDKTNYPDLREFRLPGGSPETVFRRQGNINNKNIRRSFRTWSITWSPLWQSATTLKRESFSKKGPGSTDNLVVVGEYDTDIVMDPYSLVTAISYYPDLFNSGGITQNVD